MEHELFFQCYLKGNQIYNTNIYEIIHDVLNMANDSVVIDVLYTNNNKLFPVIVDRLTIVNHFNIHSERFNESLNIFVDDISHLLTITQSQLIKSIRNNIIEQKYGKIDSSQFVRIQQDVLTKTMQQDVLTKQTVQQDASTEQIQQDVSTKQTMQQDTSTKQSMQQDVSTNKSSEKKICNQHSLDLPQETPQKPIRQTNRNNPFRVFQSDRDYTYKKLHKQMFLIDDKEDENGNKPTRLEWKDLPDFFSMKYIIFLYLDGKNFKGEQIQDSLLNTDNDFQLYNVLYKSLTDSDDFEIPEENTQLEIFEKFLDFIQNCPIPLIDPIVLTNELNNTMTNNRELFAETETEPESPSERNENPTFVC